MAKKNESAQVAQARPPSNSPIDIQSTPGLLPATPATAGIPLPLLPRLLRPPGPQPPAPQPEHPWGRAEMAVAVFQWDFSQKRMGF